MADLIAAVIAESFGAARDDCPELAVVAVESLASPPPGNPAQPPNKLISKRKKQPFFITSTPKFKRKFIPIIEFARQDNTDAATWTVP
jgi:hypothetical protein